MSGSPRISGSASSVAASSTSFGVVEGFYWKPEEAYQDQYGEYTHEQRRQLIRFIAAKGLNVYVYAPKTFRDPPNTRQERSLTLLEGDHLREWRTTFKLAKICNIDFIWGVTPPNFRTETIEKLQAKITQLVTPEAEGASVALLMDDAEGQRTPENIILQARLVRDHLCKTFPGKIKAYSPPCYHGDPLALEKELLGADSRIPKSIPFVLSGRSASYSARLNHGDFPKFTDRKIVVWDNWIASDSLIVEKNFTSPPLERDSQLLTQISGYWLNLVFPFERVIPAVASIAFLKIHQRSPHKDELSELLLGDGGVADDWGVEMGCSAHLTRAILRIKLKDRDAAINPDIEDVVKTSDIHSLDLLLSHGFQVNALIWPGKTILQLAVENGNYPLAKFLEVRGASCTQVDWQNLEQRWDVTFRPPQLLSKQIQTERRLEIVRSIDQYDLKLLQKLLQSGVSARAKNNNDKSLAEIAEWKATRNVDQRLQFLSLAQYLKILANFEKI